MLNKYFPIIDMCLNGEDTAQQIYAMVPRWRIFGDFLGPEPRTAHFRHAL